MTVPGRWTGWAAFGLLLLALLQGCTTPGSLSDAPPSLAHDARAYRQDAARRLYARWPDRVYKGRLPPMLYAVGVLQVDIGPHGQVLAQRWQRAPQHAPQVMAEIETMVRAAAPFPAPQRLGQVTYTDVWLWDRSGRFQLDTLTEGQD